MDVGGGRASGFDTPRHVRAAATSAAYDARCRISWLARERMSPRPLGDVEFERFLVEHRRAEHVALAGPRGLTVGLHTLNHPPRLGRSAGDHDRSLPWRAVVRGDLVASAYHGRITRALGVLVRDRDGGHLQWRRRLGARADHYRDGEVDERLHRSAPRRARMYDERPELVREHVTHSGLRHRASVACLSA